MRYCVYLSVLCFLIRNAWRLVLVELTVRKPSYSRQRNLYLIVLEKLSFLYGEISPQTLVTQKNSFCYWRDKYIAHSAKVGQLVFSEIQE